MHYLPEFITVMVAHLLAVMVPGPDFALVSRNSLVYSRRVARYTSLGLAAGIGVHVTYSLVGIGLLIAQSIVLFSFIKLLGAGYLIYIGYKSIQSKPGRAVSPVEGLTAQLHELSRSAAVKMGFLTNVLNPKATLFFLSLFTQIISKETPRVVLAGYGVEMVAMTFVWFSLVGTILSSGAIKKSFVAVQHYFEKFFGVVLIALGIKVALSTRQ